MANDKRLIQPVKDNKDKQVTYRQQMEKYNKAMEIECYFEGLIIVYAMMEDRLKSFLYYSGVFMKQGSLEVDVPATEAIIKEFMKTEVDEKLELRDISKKITLIRKLIKQSQQEADNNYLRILGKEFSERLDVKGFLKTLTAITKWSRYRNEVIHGLLNKNVDSLNSELRERVEEGMVLARSIDKQVKLLKRKNTIRRELNI